MSSVDIKWSATHGDDEAFETPFAKDQLTILGGSWADCEENAEAAALATLKSFVDERFWKNHVGEDWSLDTVRLRITEPASIAGDYEVDLELKIDGIARRC